MQGQIIAPGHNFYEELHAGWVAKKEINKFLFGGREWSKLTHTDTETNENVISFIEGAPQGFAGHYDASVAGALSQEKVRDVTPKRRKRAKLPVEEVKETD